MVCPPFQGYPDLMNMVQKFHHADEGHTTALCLSTEIAMKYYSPFSIQLEGKKNGEEEKNAMDFVTQSLGEDRVHKMNLGGEPVSQLVGITEEKKYDLLIFGDADKGLTKKMTLHSPIPTLIFRGGKSMERILLCSDGSEFSLEAARFTARIAEMTGATVTILTVQKADDQGFQAEEAINSTRAVLQEEGVPSDRIKTEIERGRIVDTILSKEVDYDLVAMAPRGLHRIARALMGHVSQNVLEKGCKNVLMVK